MLDKPVQHKGEFVLTKSENLDFGEISADIARLIKRQAGKIRLRIGVQIDGADGNYGEKHIERPERKEALKKCGYSTARDFIEDTYSDYDAIYQGQNGSLILTKFYAEKNHIAIVKLTPAENGDFYDVQTATLHGRAAKTKNRSSGNAKKSGCKR